MKIKIDTYHFDASAKTIKFLDYDTIDLERILLITNATDNIIIYNFADATKGGTVAANVLTLDYDTTSMDDADKLLIFYQEKDSDADNSDLNTHLLLDQILSQLKKVNAYFKIVTQIDLEEGDS